MQMLQQGWLPPNLLKLLPDAVSVTGIILLTILAAIRKEGVRKLLALLTTVFVLAPLALSFRTGQESQVLLSGALTSDGLAVYFQTLFAIAALLLLWVSKRNPLKNEGAQPPEFYPVLLSLIWGMSLMARSRHLIMMVVSLEIVSVSAYGLAAFNTKNAKAAEAALKYLIFGAFSTAISLYGISWLYGFTGSLNPYDAQFGEALCRVSPSVLLLVVLLVLGAFAFKVSAFPFHFWAPDVYEGVSWQLAAFFSVGPKLAGFALLYRFIYPLIPFTELQPTLFGILSALMIASMLLGNLSALRQNKIRRMIAFSGVAQAGFMLLGFLPLSIDGFASSFFYMGVYVFMNFGLFALAGWLEDQAGIQEFGQLGKYQGAAGLFFPVLVIFTAGLTGIPGTAGFTGKLALFASVSQSGFEGAWLMVAFAALNILPAMYYYFQLPARLIFSRNPTKILPALPGRAGLLMLILSIPVIWLGLFHFGDVISFLRGMMEKV